MDASTARSARPAPASRHGRRVPRHALGRGGGAGAYDRPGDARERWRLPAALGNREGGHGGLGEAARRSRSAHHCAEEIIEAIIKALAPPARIAPWPAGGGASGSRSRAPIPGPAGRSSGTCPGGGRAAPRPPATGLAGGRRAAGGGWYQVRQPRGRRGRFPLFFRRHEFRPDSGGAGRYRGGPGAKLEMVVEVAEPAVANTAGDGVRHGACGMLGGEDGDPIATC